MANATKHIKRLLDAVSQEILFFEPDFALISKQGFDVKQNARRVFTAKIVTRIANA